MGQSIDYRQPALNEGGTSSVGSNTGLNSGHSAELDQFLKEFGQRLKVSRKKKGLSQVTAAQTMRIDYRHYQNIEGGKINLRLDTLIKLIRFYELDKSPQGFTVDACLDLIGGSKPTFAKSDSWSQLLHKYVESGVAGHFSFNLRSKTLESLSPKIVQALGYRQAQDLIGRSVHILLQPESLVKIDELRVGMQRDLVSQPMALLFRAQPPAFPIAMTVVLRVHTDSVSGETSVQGIVFDRRTAEDESQRLHSLLSGPSSNISSQSQLRAV